MRQLPPRTTVSRQSFLQVHLTPTASHAAAEFYIVRYGIKPDRLTFNHQVYRGTKVTIPGLNTDVEYYFTVDAVNDPGVTKGAEVKPVVSKAPPGLSCLGR